MPRCALVPSRYHARSAHPFANRWSKLSTLPGLFYTISGIGAEDLYYDETREKDSGDVAVRLVYLRQIHGAGTTVLVVDYVDDGSGSTANAARIADFESRVTAEGFIPYAARDDRELDEIN
jgi:cysteinyl-tRNA synthetase